MIHMSAHTAESDPTLPSGVDAEALLRPASAGLAPCVWEAEVLAHEREAFIRHVLAGSGPLEQRLDAWSADALTVAPQAAV
jgi:hypothetical protein